MTTETPPTPAPVSAPGEESYKYAWSRQVARQSLERDLATLKERIGTVTTHEGSFIPQLEFDDKTPIRDIVKDAKPVTGPGVVAPKAGQFKVAIVGAGVAGLFSAMLFEWLNKKVPGLKIDYDLIEAAGEERLGGRLYTHYFSELSEEEKKKGWVNHDYYDVGAMRYPDNDIMKRTFQLFEMLGMKKFDEKSGEKEKVGDLIRYYMKDGENDGDPGVCPSYFNNVRQVGRIFDAPKATANPPDDPYKLNSGLPDGSKIPEKLLSQDPSSLVEKALKPLLVLVKDILDEKQKAKNSNREFDDTQFWRFFMKTDHMSTRQYLALDHIPQGWELFLKEYHRKHQNDKDYEEWKPPAHNYNTIEWLETATYGTGWYDQALSETVLEELDFGTVSPKDWWCISGGTQTVPRTMAKKIDKKVQFHSQVVAINSNVLEHGQKPKQYVPLTLTIDKSSPDGKEPAQRRNEDYLAVFNSTTLAAMQRMDLQNAGLHWGTKQAIRALGYGASCKVAIKFKTPWWQLPPYNINMGSVARTDLPLRVCVYPSYNIEALEGKVRWEHSKDNPSVLLCSYTWGQDAQRIGSLISRNEDRNGNVAKEGKEAEKDKQLKSLLLRNLALLHAVDDKQETYEALLKQLEGEYVDHHAWDWYRDENMSGAFAYFGPSQYSSMWQEIIKPNAFGQLYLVGEASSSHHAWIVGALESVVRAAYLLFEGLQSGDPECLAYSQAMELLKYGEYKGQDKKTVDKKDDDLHLPFWPLPAEMPLRQEGVKSGALQTDLPEKAVAENEPLTYAAAVAALSLVESFFEVVVPVMEPTAVAA